MSSNLTVKQGIYDPTKRFEFTNITNKDFTFSWDKSPITVKAGEKAELPHYLAVLATGQLVDQIMFDAAKEDQDKMRIELKNPNYISPKAMSAGIPAMREPYEKKICREVAFSESKMSESQLGIIRGQLKETLQRDLNAKASAPISSISIPSSEFEELNLPKAK